MGDVSDSAAQLEHLLEAFRRAISSMEGAEAALRQISVARLPAVRTTLEHAASEMESLQHAVGEAVPTLRRAAAVKRAGLRLANVNRRLQALYRAAAGFHALLLRARSIERTGYGVVVQADNSIGAWLPTHGHQLRAQG
jgi:hypothetical protein